MAALVVIVAQLVWRAVVLSQGYFSQDDFLVMSAVDTDSWSDRLTADYAGGFSPGASLLVWLSTSVAPLAWGVAATTVLLLEAAAALLMWLVLTRLLGERWIRIPVLVLFAFSTQTLWVSQWWVLGLEFWTATLMLLVAVWAMLRSMQDGDRRLLALVVGAFAVALGFDERAVLQPVVLVGVALVAHAGPTLRTRVSQAARDQIWAWLGLALVIGGYAVLRWQVAPLEGSVGDEVGDVLTTYLRHGLSEVFGGPWLGDLPAHAYLVPTSWVVAVNGALLLALAGATLQRGGAAARVSWAMLAIFVAGSVGVLAVKGQGSLLASLGLVHRFAAELAPVAAICIAGALSGVSFGAARIGQSRELSSARVEGGTVVLSAVALTVSAAVSTTFLAPNLRHADDRSYVEHLRADLREHPQVVLFDAGVPAGVISPWYGDRARVSTVVGQAPENPVFDLPSHALRIVGDDGRIVPVRLEGVVRTEPSDDTECGYPVRTVGVEVPMQASVPTGRWVLRVGYYTATEGFATIGVAGATQRFPVRTGLNAVDLVVEGEFDGFRATFEESGASLCLTDASVGVPRPDER